MAHQRRCRWYRRFKKNAPPRGVIQVIAGAVWMEQPTRESHTCQHTLRVLSELWMRGMSNVHPAPTHTITGASAERPGNHLDMARDAWV